METFRKLVREAELAEFRTRGALEDAEFELSRELLQRRMERLDLPYRVLVDPMENKLVAGYTYHEGKLLCACTRGDPVEPSDLGIAERCDVLRGALQALERRV